MLVISYKIQILFMSEFSVAFFFFILKAQNLIKTELMSKPFQQVLSHVDFQRASVT